MNEKTIRMPKELLDKWLAALRSGEYKQGRNELRAGDMFCCLGVLQMAADGDVEWDDKDSGVSECAPSLGWLAAHNVQFNCYGAPNRTNPFLPTLGMTAIDANDDECKSFAEIADAIEACAEAT